MGSPGTPEMYVRGILFMIGAGLCTGSVYNATAFYRPRALTPIVIRILAECWQLYTEVLGDQFSNIVLFGQVHQLTVDAYAVQHSGGGHPDKSTAVHLSGL